MILQAVVCRLEARNTRARAVIRPQARFVIFAARIKERRNFAVAFCRSQTSDSKGNSRRRSDACAFFCLQARETRRQADIICAVDGVRDNFYRAEAVRVEQVARECD